MNSIINFEVPLIPVFTNDMYMSVLKKSSRTKSGYWATTARTPALKYYQKMMQVLLKTALPLDSLEVRNFINAFNSSSSIEVTTTHYIKDNNMYNSIDVSNTIKSYEDCIATHLGIDDKYTTKYVVNKIYSPNQDPEWVCKTTMLLINKD